MISFLPLFSDLINEASVFTHEDIVDYTELAIDKIHGNLLVGSRNSLFSLSLENLKQQQHVKIAPLDTKQQNCALVNARPQVIMGYTVSTLDFFFFSTNFTFFMILKDV